jgi:hypothetical protein
VPIPEGQAIVICPFCELRSVVRGERGVRRYQVPTRITQEQAQAAYQKFLTGSLAISRDARRKARLTETLLVHLPFWAAWGLGLGWTFGQEQVGSGDKKRLEPREIRVLESLSWNAAACDVREFGVYRVALDGRPMEPFESEQLHLSGMVFEPVGSRTEAVRLAEVNFQNQVAMLSSLDRTSQAFVRIVRPRLGMVYYPLWVLRYEYRGRAFQVVVDGYNGDVLYGKAPGNVWYRAAVLVGGMALGAFVGIDLGALILSSGDSEGAIGGGLAVFAVGLGIMYAAYRTFRYGEHYEYRRQKEGDPNEFFGLSLPGGAKDAFDLIRKGI